MQDRNGRPRRATELQQHGLCGDYKHNVKVGTEDYVERMLQSKVVWSPHGNGMLNSRDLEA